MQARERLIERGVAAERMLAIDSDTAAAGNGFMAIAAANAVRAGADLPAAAEAALELCRVLKR